MDDNITVSTHNIIEGHTVVHGPLQFVLPHQACNQDSNDLGHINRSLMHPLRYPQYYCYPTYSHH